ncbi:MAG: flavodoxin family protein [Planctomycetes bacterium]|nr:flavodoxin family protein [Planctomycetota bacterium]
MKVLSIFASPDNNGNTATVLCWIEDNLRSSEHELERVNLYELNIIGFCGQSGNGSDGDCKEGSEKSCCNDDATKVIEKMTQADLILFASPLYGWDVSSVMKALWERIFMSKLTLKLRDKKAALIVTAGGPYENNADFVGEIFNRGLKYTKIVNIGDLILTECTNPKNMDEKVKNRTESFSKKIEAELEANS